MDFGGNRGNRFLSGSVFNPASKRETINFFCTAKPGAIGRGNRFPCKSAVFTAMLLYMKTRSPDLRSRFPVIFSSMSGGRLPVESCKHSRAGIVAAPVATHRPRSHVSALDQAITGGEIRPKAAECRSEPTAERRHENRSPRTGDDGDVRDGDWRDGKVVRGRCLKRLT